MASGVLKGLKAIGPLVGSVTGRIKIAKKGDGVIPPLDSHLQNRIKNALHPVRQHLVVQDIVVHSPDVKTFVLAPDATRGTAQLAYPAAGQYICIKLVVDGARISRPYSLSSSPKEALEGHYTLTIKRVEGGICSGYALDHWQVGTKVDATAPLGEFCYQPLRDAPTVVGIAGGSGITPFYSMAKAIVDGDEDFRLVLLYGSRTREDILFLPRFRQLQQASDGKFRLVNVLSNEQAEGCEQGFITADLIRRYAPADAPYSVFLCGPQAMYNFVDAELAKLGLRRKYIRHELFGEYHYPERNADYPQDAVGQTFPLHIRILDKTYDIQCRADETLLNAMEHNGIVAPSECRSGTCGACHSRLVSGEVYVPAGVDGRRMADLQFGYVHPCCTFPLGEVCIEVPADNNC